MAAAAASLSSRSKLSVHHLSLSTFCRFFSSPPPPSTSLPSSSSYAHLHRLVSGDAKNSINAAALPPLTPKQNKKRTCACSPSTHPGSFRCSLHKSSTMMSRDINNPKKEPSCNGTSSKGYDLRKSTMTKWALRFGGVDEEMVETLTSASFRPCHQRLLPRHPNFRLQPSRLSVMSTA